jgi:hypothetical protein
MKIRSITKQLTLAALTVLATLSLHAADISGDWTWSTPGRSGGPDRTSKLTLAEDHGKLVGKVSAPGRDGTAADSPITNGKVDGAKISFDVVREFDGNKFTSRYSGEVGADKITGKISFDRNGNVQTSNWEAKRVIVTK